MGKLLRNRLHFAFPARRIRAIDYAKRKELLSNLTKTATRISHKFAIITFIYQNST